LLETTHQLDQVNRELMRLSAMDGLTGLANRRHFDTVLRSEWDRSAALLAMIHNVNCSRATSMKAPEKFHPFPRHSARRRLSPQESVAAIALAFCIKRKGDK
ncbi:MAG: hypothetical protein ACK53V_22510, partial [Planctomycetota bacterium]